MKTVLHYKDGPYLPITEGWIYNQIKNLGKYQPIIYATSTENLDMYPVGKIRSLRLKERRKDPYTFFNRGCKRLFDFYPYFAFSLMRDKPDVVHAHFGYSGCNFLTLKKFFKLPLITTFYGHDLSRALSQYPEWKKKYEKLFHKGESFLVEGNHMRKRLIELGCPGEKIIVQHLGVDLNRIKFVPRKLGGDGEIKILISASFREKKGIPYAVEAFGQVKNTHPEVKLKLTVIGDSAHAVNEEEEKKEILGVMSRYCLNDYVRMMGYQPYSVFLRELYQHHTFLHPSIHASDGDIEGGVPVSIIEASASGMPILSTTHCDIPEVVIDRESGYLVPERDVNALAEKLEILVSNPDIWEQMGKKGRRHVEKNYDIKKQSQRLEEIYDKVAWRNSKGCIKNQR
ncbi:glycosyltransferase [bacterium]|nr:glycosyltransferase [bacterium]